MDSSRVQGGDQDLQQRAGYTQSRGAVRGKVVPLEKGSVRGSKDVVQEAAAQDRKLDVIYIAGVGRSGSTLVERLLEAYPNVCSVGEIGLLSYFVKRLGKDFSEIGCPCGSSMADCESWKEIRDRAGLSDAGLAELVELQHNVLRTRSFFLALIPFVGRDLHRQAERLAELTFNIYRAAANATGSDVVIDCSNIAAGALVASRMPDVKLHILHVVRSPEAVVQSWRSTKFHPGFGMRSDQRAPLGVLFDWWLHNVMAEMMRFKCRDVVVCRYESLVETPRKAVTDLFSHIRGEEMDASPAFVSANEVKLDADHAILGNPDRFRQGVIAIRNDERFRRELPFSYRWLSVLLTIPLRFVYRYRVFR